MNTADEIKEAVRSKYDSIARGAWRGEAGRSSPEATCVGDSYAQVRGHVAGPGGVLSSGRAGER